MQFHGHPVQVSRFGGCPHMFVWVGPHVPSFWRQLWEAASRVEYFSPYGVLLNESTVQPPQPCGLILGA